MRKKKDTLGRVMSKVRRGKRLTKTERKIIGAAVDGAKKARSEYGKRRGKRMYRMRVG